MLETMTIAIKIEFRMDIPLRFLSLLSGAIFLVIVQVVCYVEAPQSDPTKKGAGNFFFGHPFFLRRVDRQAVSLGWSPQAHSGDSGTSN